jgi:hypothetical protein
MPIYLIHPKSYSLKILPVSPYYSKILMLSSLQLYCFHRPGGEGGTLPAGAPRFPHRQYPKSSRCRETVFHPVPKEQTMKNSKPTGEANGISLGVHKVIDTKSTDDYLAK